jgi:hypothetical protein
MRSTIEELVQRGDLEGGEVVLDPSLYPKQFREGPELASLVQQGKLPPAAERIGQDPAFAIGVVSHGLTAYSVRYAKTNLGNVPERVLNSATLGTPLNALPMTFYFK